MKKIHELKTATAPFAAMREGKKRFEYRRDDRGFAVGDLLLLREWDEEDGAYTGRVILASVLYLLVGGVFCVPSGFCVMSIEVMAC